MKKLIGLLTIILLLLIPAIYSEQTCGEWTKCKPIYGVDQVISGDFDLLGAKERVCIEDGKETIERKSCDLKIPIYTKEIKYCYEDYIEIYNLEGQLIGRIKKQDFSKKLDIDFTIAEEEYCPYCYDNKLNYDEEMVDCGGSCPPCEYFEEGTGVLISSGKIEIKKIENINEILDKWKNNELSLETAVKTIYGYFS